MQRESREIETFFFSFLLSQEGQLKNVLYYNIKYNSIYGAKHNSKSNIVECFLLFSRRSLHWNWFNSIMNLIFRISLTWEQQAHHNITLTKIETMKDAMRYETTVHGNTMKVTAILIPFNGI